MDNKLLYLLDVGCNSTPWVRYKKIEVIASHVASYPLRVKNFPATLSMVVCSNLAYIIAATTLLCSGIQRFFPSIFKVDFLEGKCNSISKTYASPSCHFPAANCAFLPFRM